MKNQNKTPNGTCTIEYNGTKLNIQSFVVEPSFNDLCVVHKSVVQRLAALLPTANLDQIKRQFKLKVIDTISIEEFVNLLEEELAFHRTINMINAANVLEQEEKDTTCEEAKEPVDWDFTH